MATDILVKIGADAKQFNDEIDKIQKKNEDLKDALAGVAKVSAVAFAAVAGAAGIAIKAFGDAEKASNELNQALALQGKEVTKTAESYKKYAKAVSDATGVDDDAIVAAQAKLQALIGQTEITPQLTAALVDLSTQTGSLDSASEKLGLAFQGNTAFFNKQRIEVDQNATAQERLDQAIKGVNARYGGQAAAQAQGVGSTAKLNVAISNLLENIGERLAPAFTIAVNALTKFVNTIANDGPLLDFAVAAGKIIAVFAGSITVITSAGLAFIKMKEAMQIANIAIRAIGLSARGALLSSGIGALIVIAALVFENWNTIWPAIKNIFVSSIEGIITAAKKVGVVLKSVFQGDFSDIKKNISSGGFDIAPQKQVQADFNGNIIPSKGDNEAAAAESAKLAAAEKSKQDILNKAAQDRAADQARSDALKREQAANTEQIILLQAQQGSEELIKLKQQENDILKQLDDAKNADIIAALEQRLATTRLLEEAAAAQSQEEDSVFKQQILANNADFQALSAEQQNLFLAQQGAALKGSIDSETEAKNKALATQLQQQIAAHNQFLADQQKFGTGYAEINKTINSNEVQGFSKATGELAQLQNSKNKELKAVGKAAAIADVTIKTAQSAMAIYAGFAPIPFVGPVLGVAGAALAVAFGAEQIGNIVAANEGGIVPGGGPNVDSQMSLLTPGELVVPRSNFSEVVNAVAAQRVQTQADEGGSAPAGVVPVGSQTSILIGFDGPEAEKVLTQRRVEARSLGTLREATV